MNWIERCRAAAACLAVVAIGAACTDLPTLPIGSQSYDPPPEYQLWWNMTESCSGLRGSLADVSWFVVPGVETLPGVRRNIAGEWFEQGNRIVVAGTSQVTGSLIRHEMLHALVRASNHPRVEFLERCAGFVFCGDECTLDAEAAPIPPVGTPIASPGALEIGIEIQQAPLSASKFGGYFTILVTARNPANHAVLIDLSPLPGTRGVSFEYALTTGANLFAGANFDFAYDSEETYFHAGETKRAVFDLFVGTRAQGGLAPGSYTAYGYFGGEVGGAQTFTVTQ